MYAAIVSTAFWLIFSVPALGALVFLLGTIMRSSQLTTGRATVDDGSEDPASASYRIYELDLRSTALSIAAGVCLIPLGAAAFMAVLGTTVLTAASAIVIAAIAFWASDALRTRHERLETAFEELSGMSVQEAYARVIDRPPPLRPARIDDRAAPGR